MKNLIILAAMAALAIPGITSAADVGVSVTIGEPGFYGRIDIGTFPQPQLVYPRPIIIQPVPVPVAAAPMYLHIPPGHIKKWSKHCHQYNACGRPVYFVQDIWYNDVYVPAYQERHRGDHRSDHDDHGDHGDHGHDHDDDHQGGGKSNKGNKGNKDH